MQATLMLPPVALLTPVIQDAATFYEKNWLLATAGNLSVRHTVEPALAQEATPTETTKEPAFWITASGLDKGRLTPSSFMACTVGGQAFYSQEQRAPSAETLLHSVIYQTIPTANVVYHTHSVAATRLGLQLPPRWQAWPLPQVEMVKALGASTHLAELELLVFENTQDMETLSQTLHQVLATTPVPAFLLKGHGLYAWGNTPQQAKRHLEGLEFLFQLALA
jgi:methylthioribulose-1-phosphate dehydratase